MAKKVLLLTGGFSAERDVSLAAGKDIAGALMTKGYDVVLHDLTDVWQFIDVLRAEKPDVVFNGLYGKWGEDGTIQGMLDLLQIPYTHSGMRASVIGMDKSLTKLVARNCRIKVAEGYKTTVHEFVEKGAKMTLPYVVKPVSDGSSVGVFIIKIPEDLQKINYANQDTEILVEKYISGHELTVMCLNGRAYVVTELKAAKEFYDYEAKYTDGITRHVLPAEIPENVAETCKNYAEKLHRELGCRTVSRSDFRWNEADGVVLLEINTNPGMTSLSLVPEQAKYAGTDYATLCAELVENAQCRKIS